MKITISQLRKLIRESLNEDQELLKKWASKTDDVFEQWLLSQGYTPIPRSDKSSQLGAGAFAIAYEVEKNGKHLVAKFIPENEVQLYQKVKALKQQVPEQYSKNIVTVYEILNIDGEPLISDRNYYQHCAIVEYLMPVSKNVLKGLWTLDEMSENNEVFKDRLQAFVHDDNVNLAKIIAFASKESKVKLTPQHVKRLQQELAKKFAVMMKIFDEPNGSWQLYMKLTDALKHAVDKAIQVLSLEEMSASYLSSILVMRLTEALNGAVFPGNSTQNLSNFKSIVSDKKMLELFNSLQYLSIEHAFAWNDLHQDNIMRRKDGTYVVSDVGGFLVLDE